MVATETGNILKNRTIFSINIKDFENYIANFPEKSHVKP